MVAIPATYPSVGNYIMPEEAYANTLGNIFPFHNFLY